MGPSVMHLHASKQARLKSSQMSEVGPSLIDGKGDKRVRKLKKALKRIGELRLMNYVSLTTDQRKKIHGEWEVLEELGALLPQGEDVELLRLQLQPRCPQPMPKSQHWTPERSAARAKERSEAMKILQKELGLQNTQSVRRGDWKCPDCGAHCFASRDSCFNCGSPR